MKAAAFHILDEAEREADSAKVNALEQPLALAAYVIPATWTPEHVLKRILEAVGRARQATAGPSIPTNGRTGLLRKN